MDEATCAYLQSVVRSAEVVDATRVPCRGRWRVASKLPALGLTPEREPARDDQDGEEVALPDGLVPLLGGRVRIVARPGLGKTTLLLALHARLARAALAGERVAVPVFIALRYWSGSLEALVGDALREHGWELTDEEAAGLAGAGGMLLLLDGLNELPDKPAREQLDRWLRTHPRVAVVVTTRLPGDASGDSRVLELQPLSDDEISAVAKTYLEARGEAMLAALAAPGREALWEMARTPLLLAMLCSGYGELAAVPRNPAELLRHGLRQQRGDDEQTRAAMGYLAHASVADAPSMQLVLKRPRVEELLGRFLQARGESAARAAELCDRLLREHLLAAPRPLALVFPHQLVQEFYVAEHLLATRDKLLADLPHLRRAYLARTSLLEPLTLLLGLLPLGDEGRRQALALVREAVGLDDLLAATLIRGMRDEWQTEVLSWIDRAELGPSLQAALLCVTQAPAAVVRLAVLWDAVDVHCRWEILDTLARIATLEGAEFAARRLLDPAELVETDQTELAKAAEVILQARAVQRHGQALIAAARRIAAVPHAFGAETLLRAVGQLADAAAAEALLEVSLAQGRLLVEHWDELACPLDRALLARVCALAEPEEVGQPLGSCVVAFVERRGPIDVGSVWRAVGPAHQKTFLVHSPQVYAIPATCVRPLLATGDLLSDALRWVARTGETSLSDAVCGLCDRLATRPGWEHIQVGRALAAIGDDACVDRLLAIVRGDGETQCRQDALEGLVRATRVRGTTPPWSEMPERLRREWTNETPGTRWGVAAHRAAEVEELGRALLADAVLADAAGELLVHAWPEPANVVRVAAAESDAPRPLRAITAYVAWRAEVGTAAELAALLSEPAIEAAVVRALACREVGLAAVVAARLIPGPAITEALFDAFISSDRWFGSDGHGRNDALRAALLERGDPALGVRLLAVAFAAHYTPRPGLTEALALLGERWLDAVVDARNDGTYIDVIELCSQRGEQLRQASSAARTRLTRVLLAELPHDGVAWKTCELLAKLNDVVGIDEVVTWLAGWRSQQLYASPVLALRAFAVANEQLLCWLVHPSAALRMGAATALCERADRQHLERLIGLLAVPVAAPFAARALAVSGWALAIPALSELASAMRIEQTDVYTEAIAAIGGPAAAAALFRLAQVQHPGAALLLRSLSAEDRYAVSAPHLEDPAAATRVLALELLEDVTPLLERVRALLADPDPAVVRAAVGALRNQEAPGLAAELWRLRAGGEAALVETIDRTLATLPDAETWPLVLPGLRAGDVAAAELAEQLYPCWFAEPSLDAATLVQLLASPAIEVRWFAVDRLRPTVEHAEAMLATVPAARDDETYIPGLRLALDGPIEPARRTANLRGKVLYEMERAAGEPSRPEAERAWMAQRLALHGGVGNVGTAVKLLFGLATGPAVLRTLVDDPRRGKFCLERLFYRSEPVAREVLCDVLRTGTPQQRQLVLARAPGLANTEDLPWIREELERWIVRAEVDPAQSLWGGPLAAIQRVGTLADVGLLYRVARTTRQGAWVFAVLEAIGQLQARLGRIAELPEPAPRTQDEAPGFVKQVELPARPTAVKSREEALHMLLSSVFSEDHLRRFLRSGEQGDAVVQALPGAISSFAALVDGAVTELVRRGIVTSLWRRLHAEFPARSADIDRVAALWR